MSQASTTTSDVPQGVQEEVIDLDEHAEGRRARDDDDEAAEDDPEVLAGMMAGFKAVNGDANADDDQQTTTPAGKKRFGGGSDQGDEDDGDDGGGDDAIAGADAADGADPRPGANDDDDRVVFGGMTAKQLREKLERTDSLERTTNTLAGRIGHLQQQMQAAGKPRALTKDDFPSLREEFGDEYAEAVARDLSKVVTGGPMSEQDLEQVVATRMAEMERKTERKIVAIAHPDAADYFAGGKQHEAFMGWIKTQPEERQQVLMNSWDSNDIIPALNDFKSSITKAAREAAAKGNRIARSVGAGTSAAGGEAPTDRGFDPIEAGWRKARGKPGQGQMSARRH